MTRPKIALLTNCTSSSNFAPLMDIEEAPTVQTMDELCTWWTERMALLSKEMPKELRTPGELYNGIAFDTVTEIAQIIGHENIFVVNRGAGLVRHDKKLLPYNFTYDKKDKLSAHNKVVGEKFLPHLWWGKINQALYKEASPITKIKAPDGTDYDYILVALPKGFVRLIVNDLAHVPNKENRVFIPIPQSGGDSVPRDIRSICIPYTKAYTQDIDFSRYNKCHRIAQRFLMDGLESGNFLKHANAVRDAQHAFNGQQVTDETPYEEMFKNHPELLESNNAAVAMQRAKMMGLRIGSRLRFTGAWKGAQGTQETPEVTKDEKTLAVDSLRQVMEAASAKVHSSDDELLKRIGIFIVAVKQEDPTIIFTSKEVAAWGVLVYGKKDKHSITSSGKITSMLRSHTAYLGLEQIHVGSQIAYRLPQ